MRRPRYVLCIGFIFNYLRYCSKDVNHYCEAGGRSEWLISASDLSGSGWGGGWELKILFVINIVKIFPADSIEV